METGFLQRELPAYTTPALTKEQEEERDLDLIIWNVGIIKDYVTEVAKISEARKVEDTLRNISTKTGGSDIWTDEEQRFLESERQREDYLMMKKHLPGWVALEEDAPATTIMIYRQRFERLLNGEERRQELKSENETIEPNSGFHKALSATHAECNREVRTDRIAKHAKASEIRRHK